MKGGWYCNSAQLCCRLVMMPQIGKKLDFYKIIVSILQKCKASNELLPVLVKMLLKDNIQQLFPWLIECVFFVQFGYSSWSGNRRINGVSCSFVVLVHVQLWQKNHSIIGSLRVLLFLVVHVDTGIHCNSNN